MKRTKFLSLFIFCSVMGMGQNINATFTGTGAANQIDSVTATNLTTNQSVTLPGNETLLLTLNTGIPSVSELTGMGMVFPNPFSGKATFTTDIQKPQRVCLRVQDLLGQVVAQTWTWVQPGENEFGLSVIKAGIYFVSLTTEKGTASYKVICTGAIEPENRIQYFGSTPNNHNHQNNHNNPSPPDLKTSLTGYFLEFAVGDVILYRCMSGNYTTIVTDSPISSKNYDVEFVACMDPDGKNYSVVSIGTQTWMAENLAYMPDLNNGVWVYDYDGLNMSDAKASVNYSNYGCLYDWKTASSDSFENSQDICPKGWQLPNDSAWTALSDYLGASVVKKMKGTGTLYWTGPNNATNESGFTALAGGIRRSSEEFGNIFITANFWTSSEKDATHAYYRMIQYNTDFFYRASTLKGEGRSVRCLKDGIFTDDRDGQVYTYETIGTQTWMTENLAYLPAVSPSPAGSDSLPYYYVYGYEGATVGTAKATDHFNVYGVLYNWPAALTACPSGWHLPEDAEWKILEKNQGMSQSSADSTGWRKLGAIGGKLKEVGTSHWLSPNTGATNSSGFTALPGGYLEGGVGFRHLGTYAHFWSASKSGSKTWTRALDRLGSDVGRLSNIRDRGVSVRCLRN